MPADSLRDMSLRATFKITKRITDIGGMPYHLARPFLLKIENPEQLRTLEEKCPQIIGHDAEIWLALIKRDIPNWETKRHTPQNEESWWKVYRKLKKDALLEMDAGTDKLKAALNDKNDKQLAEIKPMIAQAQARGSSRQLKTSYRYQSGLTGSARGSSKMNTLQKIKKEARDIRNARTMAEQQKKIIAKTKIVTHAPTQFVEELRTQQKRAQQSPERPVRTPRPPMAVQRPDMSLGSPARTAPSPTTSMPTSRSLMSHQDLQEREACLRALTSGRRPPSNAAAAAASLKEIPKERPPRSEVPTSSLESLPKTHLYSSREQSGPPSTSKCLIDALGRPGSRDGKRSASPQVALMARKRRREPDLFMAPMKKR